MKSKIGDVYKRDELFLIIMWHDEGNPRGLFCQLDITREYSTYSAHMGEFWTDAYISSTAFRLLEGY